MKIYTKTGDSGETGLFGGLRVAKDHARVEAYGTVDEANAAIGLFASLISEPQTVEFLNAVQGRLFDIGTLLANPRHVSVGIQSAHVAELEAAIDTMTAELPEIRTFILPGGTRLSATAHLCRCVVRRAERRVVALSREAHVHAVVLRYLNRLSDYFFVLARHYNAKASVEDIPWKPA